MERNLYGSQTGYGPFSSISLSRSTRNFTEEADAHRARQTRFELPTSRLRKSSPRISSCCSCASYRNVESGNAGKNGYSRNQAGQTWTSHQVTILNEMNSVARYTRNNKLCRPEGRRPSRGPLRSRNRGPLETLRKRHWQGTQASERCPSLSVRRATSADMVEVFEVGASVFAESMSLAP